MQDDRTQTLNTVRTRCGVAWAVVFALCAGAIALMPGLRATGEADDDWTLACLHGYAGAPDHDWTIHIRRVGSFGLQGFTTARAEPLTCVVWRTDYYDLPLPFSLCVALGITAMASGLLPWRLGQWWKSGGG